MRRYKKSANPFYVLLVLVGLSFVITATTYGVMAFREVRQRQEANAEIGNALQVDVHPLMIWMRQHGDQALLAELGILAVCTFAAIGSDDYWQRRQRKTD